MDSIYRPQIGFEADFFKHLTFFDLGSGVLWSILLFLISFVIAMAWAPHLIGPLLKFSRQRIEASKRPTLYNLHQGKVGTPSMGGLLFLINTIVLAFLVLRPLQDYMVIFLGALVAIGIVGATDDYLVSWGTKYTGLTVIHKLLLQGIIAGVIALQLFLRLGYHDFIIPFFGTYNIGWLIVPIVFFVLIYSMNAVNLTDGLDGLAGGVSMFSFAAYLLIAIWQQQFTLAALIAILMGSILAFLWFNINPARFFMGDVGSLSLGLALGMSAIYTGQIVLLPIIGLVFLLETISVVLQVSWRKFFKKKLFKIAPFHHHFEANGWPETKVTMRFWLVATLCMMAGLLIYQIDVGGVL